MHSGVGEQRSPDARCDFLKKDDVGGLGSFEDMVEDELGSPDELGLRGLDIPGREAELLADGATVCCCARRSRRGPLGGGWGVRAQRYGCPATPGGVESRENTAESVRLEHPSQE